MCGPSRPSSGNLIAVIFPYSSSSTSSASSLSSSSSSLDKTKALFRIASPQTLTLFRGSKGVNVRIEYYGDLTAPITSPPLYDFRVPFPGIQTGGKGEGNEEVEVILPERLELGVSERGIVGRLVRVSLFGDGEVDMGRGIVGYN
ncbi:hypothetical protein BO94DRAFT_464392 [Aspergillus sclerotioniger CBS 115572]|uniref:Uncharacterized protein n=1 Tax=Aspergillus sclerotioniger CBS 115572 TaxID=1450535 RepID=A0A317WWG1_9EURO|nr:hypothetical protein BO94DRAFT_464392 [Aspergillus sclerotioniger CBS 115572]PWY88650.1 hypothetical protein BO94DRAFT_464392 [Aspergillus sclerotioniger CBS 115572]